MFEHASHGLVGEVDIKRCSGDCDSQPIVDYVDLDAPAFRDVVAEPLVYPDVGLLCLPRRAVVLEAAAALVGLTDIV